ncbi:hypothetical protein ACFQH1_02600 [Lactiplantibacillus daoliensis]|uniref:Integral membrane protein n=1 Tax=Lactiplantibacillus daoliensis TaxID=2559916 RepID=A0ABW1UGI5_9LACO|nr:hypothetical protein [Lactiplantibacillus daoliensis]
MKPFWIKNVSGVLVDLFFIPLILVSLLGSLSRILVDFHGLRSSAVKVVDITAFIVLLYIVSRPLRQKLKKYLNKVLLYFGGARALLLCLVIIVTVLWQIAVVILMTGYSDWDPGKIILASMDKLPNPTYYFSAYPNTHCLLFLERGVWLLSGQLKLESYAVLLSCINIILVDSAVAMVAMVVRHWFGRRYLKVLLSMSWFLIVASPWIVIPYSDVWAFFLVSLTLYLVDCFIRCHQAIYRCLLSVFLGVLSFFRII